MKNGENAHFTSTISTDKSSFYFNLLHKLCFLLSSPHYINPWLALHKKKLYTRRIFNCNKTCFTFSLHFTLGKRKTWNDKIVKILWLKVFFQARVCWNVHCIQLSFADIAANEHNFPWKTPSKLNSVFFFVCVYVGIKFKELLSTHFMF